MLMVIVSLLLLAGCAADETTPGSGAEAEGLAVMFDVPDRPWRVPDVTVDVEDWIREIIAGFERAAGVEAHVRAYESLKGLEAWIEDEDLPAHHKLVCAAMAATTRSGGRLAEDR